MSNRPVVEASNIAELYYGRHRLAFRVGTYLALLRMMGIGHLVTALHGHALLVSDTHARLMRTRQTLRDLIGSGFASEPGREAVHRLRAVHRNLPASAEDYRYVLGTFFLEPLRWNMHNGRTKLTHSEEGLLLAFWVQVGQAMEIPELPKSLPQWRRLQHEYEARRMTCTPEGHRLACTSMHEVVKLALPVGTRWWFRQLMLATMDNSVREKLGLIAPGWHTRVAAKVLLLSR